MEPTPDHIPTGREVLADRSVRFLLTANFLHTSAVIAQFLALGKLVYDITGRELDLGWLGLMEFLPVLLFVTVAGTVADRFERRHIAAIAFGCEALCSVALAWYAASEPTSVGSIYVLAFLFGTSRAFAAPAARALPVNVAPPGALPRVTAFSSTAWTLSSIAGPIIGGLLFVVGPAWPFIGAAILTSLAVVFVLLVRLRRPQEKRKDPPTWHHAIEGFRFIRRTPILFGAIALDLFAVLFGGAVALLPAIAEERLGVGAVGLGFLRAAGGIGAGITALYLAVKPLRRHVGLKLLIAVGIFGAATIVLGATTYYWVAIFAMAVLTSADMVSVFVRSTIVPLATPDEMRGRVLAVENIFIGGSNELGALESGIAGQAFGPAWAIAGGGMITLAIAGTWAVAFPGLRDVDRFEEVEPAPASQPV